MGGCVFRIQFSDGRVEERELGDGRFQIGREAGAIVLGDAKSSAVHGELVIQGAAVTYTDLGSSNGSFDAHGRRLTEPTRLSPGQSVQLGNSALTYLRAPATAVAPAPRAPVAATQPMEAVEPPAAPAPLRLASPAPGARQASGAAASGGGFSHPSSDVRHSYPLSITSAGIGEAFRLVMQTLPFLLVRFGILCALTVAAIVYWILLVGGFVFLSKATPLLGWIWIVGLLVVGGSIWRFAVRYMLYLIKAAHIAVLTELITTGSIGNGSEGMFAYGKRVVTERFGEVNAMFALDLLIAGIVGAFNRTLNWVASLLPIPGLDSVMGFVNAVLRASTTYIDETIFSYNLARGDENVYRSSKDGLIYYAQNAKEVLKTGLWVVVLDRVLTTAIWIVMLAPGFALSWLLPGNTGGMVMIVGAVLFAGSVRSAFLKPLFLTMVMVKFHAMAKSQPINLEWDQRLGSASNKFEELKQQAAAWVRPSRGPQPGAVQAA
ncbi:MAG TPA: FHA domain-containing protein [Polyangiaceae bacterium]|jgi:pSer/pThr/pTyr-binding forkhead associated (FHA) protein|nr:FHA domain-containing protein [Polyangiaceae bacterium]